ETPAHSWTRLPANAKKKISQNGKYSRGQLHAVTSAWNCFLLLPTDAETLVTLPHERAPRGDDAGRDAIPADLAREATVFNFRAAVHDHFHAGRFGFGRRFVMAYRELHPDHLWQGIERQGLVHDRRHCLACPENVHHVDRHRDVRQPGIGHAAEYFLAGMAGVYRKDLEALRNQIFQHEEAWPHLVGRCADNRDRLHLVENAGNIAVIIGVVVHAGSEIRPSASSGKSGLWATSHRLCSGSAK